MYWIYMDRRTRMEDKRAELEQQCFHLFPDRWRDLYYTQFFHQDSIFGDEEEIPVTNIDELDQFMAQLEQKRFMTGADLPPTEEGRWFV